MGSLARSVMAGMSVYSATKAAADMIVKYAAIEGAEAGVFVAVTLKVLRRVVSSTASQRLQLCAVVNTVATLCLCKRRCRTSCGPLHLLNVALVLSPLMQPLRKRTACACLVAAPVTRSL
jgi:hypothetical protein